MVWVWERRRRERECSFQTVWPTFVHCLEAQAGYRNEQQEGWIWIPKSPCIFSTFLSFFHYPLFAFLHSYCLGHPLSSPLASKHFGFVFVLQKLISLCLCASNWFHSNPRIVSPPLTPCIPCAHSLPSLLSCFAFHCQHLSISGFLQDCFYGGLRIARKPISRITAGLQSKRQQRRWWLFYLSI